MRHALVILAAVLLLIAIATPVRATVGIEYLGPTLLEMAYGGQPHTLKPVTCPTVDPTYTCPTVGNSGTEPAIITFQLTSKDPNFNGFTATFSSNNFTLSPGQRKQFTLTLTFDPNKTPAHDYTASISIQAKATSGPGVASIGAANVHVASAQVPEFPDSMLPIVAVIMISLGLLKVRRKTRND